MQDCKQIIQLYSELADKPEQDFGWDKGLNNAKAHGYEDKMLNTLPNEIWEYCAAVGNPFSYADIKEGDIVVDLGCGAGVDLLIAATKVGQKGKAIGIDITPKMVDLAKRHARLAGLDNVEVLEGGFEDIKLEDESVDIVISNGAINLSSCKESVFSEIYRILKPEGRLCFSDMINISTDEASCCSVEQTQCEDKEEEDWANCVAGTLKEDELIKMMEDAGFSGVECLGHTHYTTAQSTKGANFKGVKILETLKRQAHWDHIFQTVDTTEVLWHQEKPEISLSLIKKYSNTDSSIIDVGCGTSLLVDNLLEYTYKNITLLDTSKSSLELVQERIKNKNVNYICKDILEFHKAQTYAIWHDRAVFHFLLTQKERNKYFEVLIKSLTDKGVAIISTFALDAEVKCAGLNTISYDENTFKELLPKALRLIESKSHTHTTPKNTKQKYISFVLQKDD